MMSSRFQFSRALTLTLATVLLSHGVARGSDLEAPLREAYRDGGRVNEASVQLQGLSEPIKYLEAGHKSSHKLVVLIHGGVFSAETWKYVGTLDAFAVAGMRVVAPDMKRYSGDFSNVDLRQRLLKDFLDAIGWKRRPKSVLVIAASMGGTVAIPYLQAEPTTVAGYVSISALGLGDSGNGGGSSGAIPALLIWGELDHPTSAKAEAHKRRFVTHQMVVIPDAPHPAYLKEPRLFNELVVRFAKGARGPVPGAGKEPLAVAADWGAESAVEAHEL